MVLYFQGVDVHCLFLGRTDPARAANIPPVSSPAGTLAQECTAAFSLQRYLLPDRNPLLHPARAAHRPHDGLRGVAAETGLYLQRRFSIQPPLLLVVPRPLSGFRLLPQVSRKGAGGCPTGVERVGAEVAVGARSTECAEDATSSALPFQHAQRHRRAHAKGT